MSRKTAPKHDPYPPTTFVDTMNFYEMAPGEVQGDDRFSVKFVAVVDYSGHFWRVFRSFGAFSDNFVAGHGDAIGEKLARELFPLLDAREDMRYE